jgi:hypothetical protein
MIEENEKNEKMAKAKQEIEEILLRYNIILVPVVIHQGEKTTSRIDIMSASSQT